MEKITKCKTWFLQVQFFSAKACGELSKSDSWGIMRTWGLLLGAFSTCPSKLVNVKVSHSHFHELLRYLLIVELKMLTSESVKAEANETGTLAFFRPLSSEVAPTYQESFGGSDPGTFFAFRKHARWILLMARLITCCYKYIRKISLRGGRTKKQTRNKGIWEIFKF